MLEADADGAFQLVAEQPLQTDRAADGLLGIGIENLSFRQQRDDEVLVPAQEIGFAIVGEDAEAGLGQLVLQQPADFRGWMTAGRSAAVDLAAALAETRAGLSPTEALSGPARERVETAFQGLAASCKACHAVYRD